MTKDILMLHLKAVDDVIRFRVFRIQGGAGAQAPKYWSGPQYFYLILIRTMWAMRPQHFCPDPPVSGTRLR